MVRVELGPIGVTLTRNDWSDSLAAAPELEELGFAAIWLSGGQIDRLGQLAELVEATRRLPIGTAAINVDRFPAAAVAVAHRPGRLLAGLGGSRSHGELTAYFDELDAAGMPPSARMLAALGPRRLRLAAERTAGAVTGLTTPAHTAWAREQLGMDAALVVQQCVVLDAGAERARTAARRMVEFHLDVPGYRAHFRRLGFGSPSDRLLDAIVAWSDVDTIGERVRAHLSAGADHVALLVLKPDETDSAVPLRQLRRLAHALF